MEHYRHEGFFVTGVPAVPRYRDPALHSWRVCSNRGGSTDLALAILRLELVSFGGDDPADDNPICYF